MRSGTEPITFVHGFLGLPTDWRSLARAGVDTAVDLWSIIESKEFAISADAFQFASEKMLSALPSGQKSLLVGYSLGARLAMHALLLRPERFSAAVFISGHPGLPSETERQARVLSDSEWATRFRSESWTDLMTAWNEQSVLRPVGESVISRAERDFDRGTLARALECWSLGRQRDLRPNLTSIRVPILLLTGAADKKFTALNAEWIRSLGPGHIQHRVVAGAGHRVPWEQPQNFIEAMQGFC